LFRKAKQHTRALFGHITPKPRLKGITPPTVASRAPPSHI